MKKLKMNLISLMVISLSLSGCYDPKGETLYRVDMKLNECRVYKIAESKPELVFEHFDTIPLERCDGLWGVDSKHLAKIVREWNADQKKQESKKDNP